MRFKYYQYLVLQGFVFLFCCGVLTYMFLFPFIVMYDL